MRKRYIKSAGLTHIHLVHCKKEVKEKCGPVWIVESSSGNALFDNIKRITQPNDLENVTNDQHMPYSKNMISNILIINGGLFFVIRTVKE